MAKLSKCCFESFHGNTDRRVLFKFREIRANGKSVISCIIYLTKNFAWLSSSRYCTNCAQNLPGPAPDIVLRVLQLS